MLQQTAEILQREIIDVFGGGGVVHLRRGGEVLGEVSAGQARPGVGMSGDAILPWMSGSKPLTAAAVIQCAERGRLRLDDAVAQYIDGFESNGKGDIAIRHLLTHTAGLRTAGGNLDGKSRPEIIRAIAAAKPEWPAGQQAGYHVATSWHLLAEIVRVVDGREIHRYVQQEIFDPLTMIDCHLSLEPQAISASGDRLAGIYRFSDGIPRFDESSLNPGELSEVKPGSSGRGPARELAKFYQMLLAGGRYNGIQVLSKESVHQMTARQRSGQLDRTFGQVMDWGLGLMLNSSHVTPIQRLPYNFGTEASAEAFGHGGAQSSIGFADPIRHLIVIVLLNSMPGEVKHHQRMQKLLAAIWDDIESLRNA